MICYHHTKRNPTTALFPSGKPDFMELAKRLGLIAKRAERIMDRLISSEEAAVTFVGKSFCGIRLKGNISVCFVIKSTASGIDCNCFGLRLFIQPPGYAPKEKTSVTIIP